MKVQKLYEYKTEDKELVKSMSDYFTLALEYEVCSTEDPDDEPPVEDIEGALEVIKEQTLLDIARGKIGSSYIHEKKLPLSFFENNEKKMLENTPNFEKLKLGKYSYIKGKQAKGDTQRKKHEEYLTITWLNDIIMYFESVVNKYIDDEDEIFEILNVNNFVPEFDDSGEETLASKRFDVIEQVVDRYAQNCTQFLFTQNIFYIKDKLKEHLPNFYEKWNNTFKYELEGDANKSRILEFSPKTYIKSLNTAFEQLDDFYNDFEKQSYWVFNHRTALHVNIGLDKKNIKWNILKGLLMMRDFDRDKSAPYVFKDLGFRLNNRFCGSLLDAIKKNISGEYIKDFLKKGPLSSHYMGLKDVKSMSKHRDYLKQNIEKLDLHNIKEMEDFYNPFLVKANFDFYIKNFGIKITEIDNGYIEFRYVGGSEKQSISRELIKEKTLYFCYIVYLMTSDYRDEEYHKKAYKYLEDLKQDLNKEIDPEEYEKAFKGYKKKQKKARNESLDIKNFEKFIE